MMPATRIHLGATSKEGKVFVGQGSNDFCRAAEDERVIGKHLAFGDKCASADQAVAPDHGAIEDDGLNTDETAITNRAAVQHGLVPDRHIVSHCERAARISVEDSALLDVAVATNHDGLIVTAQHGVKPHAGVFVKDDRADDVGRVSDEGRVVEVG